MPERATFAEFIHALSTGANDAVAQLQHDFAPAVLADIGPRLKGCGLQSLYEPVGVFDRVVVRLLPDLAAGRLAVRTPQQLAMLLRRVARCRVDDLARHHRRERTQRSNEACLSDQPAREKEPWRTVSRREAVQQLRAAVSASDWDLLYARAENRRWDEIASAMGGSAASLRIKHGRLMHRLHDRGGRQPAR